MQVVAEEAHESYEEEIVMVLNSNTVEDMEDNVSKIQQWIDAHQLVFPAPAPAQGGEDDEGDDDEDDGME